MKKIMQFGIVALMISTIGLVLACPDTKVPGVDYPDQNEDGIDDSTQTFTPKSRDELFAILDYQKQHEDKGWMIKSIDVSNVDFTFKITDEITDYLFEDKEEFNQDVSNWDISNVTNMSGVFLGCEDFNQDISNWDVRNVTNMFGVFGTAMSFNQDISHWNISNVTSMRNMFEGAESFYQNLSSWDVTGKTTTDMFLRTPMENKGEWHPQGCRCGSSGCQAHHGYTVDEEGNIIE